MNENVLRSQNAFALGNDELESDERLMACKARVVRETSTARDLKPEDLVVVLTRLVKRRS